MSDHFEATPISAALERDALVASVIDSAPVGGILTDHTLQVIHTSTRAIQLLGLEVTSGSLPDVLSSSRLMRPALMARFLERLPQRGDGLRSYHVVEAADGEPRCLAVEAIRNEGRESRWIFWVEDVTAASHLQQYQMLAEIGRGRAWLELSTAAFAQRLVDAAVDFLKVDIAVVMLGDRDRLRPAATRGMLLEDDFALHARDLQYVDKALESCSPVVSDGSEWDSSDAEMTGHHYIVPLVSAGQAIGTLHISMLDDRRAATDALGFSQTLDFAFLEALSAHAGAAIANTRLFEEVRAERLKLKTVVDYIPQGVILFTARGDVLMVNDRANEIAERQWVNLNTDRRPYRMRSEAGDIVRRVDWPFFRPQQDGQPIVGEVVALDFGDRQKIVSINVVPVPSVSDDAIPAYVGTLRDITQERDRHSEREGFLQVVSHELRSPLTPLTGFLQMVRKQAETGDEIDADLVRRAELQVGRLARLIDRVLDLNQLERDVELDRRTLDLGEIARGTAELWSANPSGVKIRLHSDGDPVLVNGDADRLEQVLTNLVDNAVKHSPPGGVVEICVENRDTGPSLVVCDEGTGIPRDELPRIFDRFFSGSRARGGMGIGLYITRQLVEAHGGHIRVSSEPGCGAMFEVTLPSISH